MKATIILAGTLVLSVSLCRAQLRLTRFDAAGHMTWTNAVGDAAYRVEFSPVFRGPYRTLTNVVSTETTNSIQVGFLPTSANGFYRVVWTNAPPAEPLGSWEYQGFDEGGSLVVTGKLTFIEIGPL